MNELSLSQNLEHLMRIHGNISVSELARLTNIPQPTLHHVLSGATKNPRKNALNKIAEFFAISSAQLTGQESLPIIIPKNVIEHLKIKTIPIISWDRLKSWPAPSVKPEQHDEILVDKEVSNDSFALVMRDASMETLFPKDALLIFDAGKRPADRDFVIVSMNGNIVFNRLFIDKHEHFVKQDLENGNASLLKLNLLVDQIIGTLSEVRIRY